VIGTRLREHRAVVALAVTVATLLVLAVVILPPLLAGGDDTENDVRSTLLQGLAGLFLAAGLYFTAQTLRLNRDSAERTSKSAARTYELEREGQITERFTRAIDQLGDEKRDVRLGGIYALERIAKSSTDDHGPIMEVLTAYVREHAPWPPRAADEDKEAGSAEHRERDEESPPPTDVQAVIAVLGRRELRRKEHALDLSSVDLRHALFGKGPGEGHFENAIFRGAHLEEADLSEAHLEEADFSEAHLEEAVLIRAHLGGATLEEANLTGAKLGDATLTDAHLEQANLTEATLVANLTKAHLRGANLTGANLLGANLTGATLTEANLTGATLNGANLTEASLVRADLSQGSPAQHPTGAQLVRATLTGADLTGAILTGAILGEAVYDSETTWPAGFDPKAEGARLPEEDVEDPKK
jgi:uncharacterized protein YjbI with pentapeptide repeats